MQFIDLAAQYEQHKARIDQRIQTVLQHGRYIMGPEVSLLEERLAEYVGVKHCLSCANGTDALQLSLMALGIGAGDVVFCPTFTFFATAEVIALAGATPVFVDSNPSTFNMCPVDLEKRIEQVISAGEGVPKGIIAVDLFGLPANYPEVTRIANKYGLKLIEDAAQGFGGAINGKRAGSFGDIATTSFFPAKPLGCYGDGGAIFTDSDEYAELIRSFRVHGQGEDKYDNVRIGVNSRLDTLQAAILLEKLSIFPAELEARNRIAELYSTELAGRYAVPLVPTGYLSSWAQYTLVDESRDFWMKRLSEFSIPSMVYYRTSMHNQSAFKHLGYSRGDFPNADRLQGQVFSLPMHPYLSERDVLHVVSVLKNSAI